MVSTFTPLSCLLLWKILPSDALSLFLSLSQFISMVDKVFSGFCDQRFTGNKDSRPRQVMQACAPSTLGEETGSRIQSQFRLNRVSSTWAT